MIIGLAGKSCSGKNYVGTLLSHKGFQVMDLDVECAKIRRECRDDLLSVFGTYDSGELASIVFSDPEKLKQLEQIIYPRLKEVILECKYDLVINGATLHRSGLDEICSYIIYIDAPYDVRLKRALNRDKISEKDFRKRDSSQNDIDYRSVNYRCPVYVIDNTDGIKEQDLDRILTLRKDS